MVEEAVNGRIPMVKQAMTIFKFMNIINNDELVRNDEMAKVL